MWPENWQAFLFFASLQTQWRHSMNGPTGLDYTAALAMLDRMPMDADDRALMFEDVRVMEAAALAEIHERED